jgi:hypothetical protein
MSNLNGESLHDWISSEKKRATRDYYLADTDEEEAFYQGVLATLEILRQKLSTGQVNPYGDRRPTSD